MSVSRGPGESLGQDEGLRPGTGEKVEGGACSCREPGSRSSNVPKGQG